MEHLRKLLLIFLISLFSLLWGCTTTTSTTTIDPNAISITFDVNGGRLVSSIMILPGDTVNLSTPEKEYAIFGGWYLESDFSGERITDTSTITQSTTLYALWFGGDQYFNREYWLSVNDTNEFTQISLNQGSSVVLTEDQTMFIWGNIHEYKNVATSDSLVEITNDFNLEEGETIIKAVAGGMVYLFLTSSGNLYGFGRSEQFELGIQTQYYQATLINDNLGLHVGESIADVYAGQYANFLVTSEGRILAMGYNPFGALGSPDFEDFSGIVDITDQFLLSPDDTIVEIANCCDMNSGYHVLTETGRLFVWLSSTLYYAGVSGGDDNTIIEVTSYFPLHDGELIVEAMANCNMIMVLTNEHRVMLWGYKGTVGLEDIRVNTPEDVTNDFGLNEGEYFIHLNPTMTGFFGLTNTHRLLYSGEISQIAGIDAPGFGYMVTGMDFTLLFDLDEGEYISGIINDFQYCMALTNNGKLIVWKATWV